jgi:isopentenyl diphosphate isomerase/L-lactate dehydrogenase-like FMN-dependent dehydrogenase
VNPWPTRKLLIRRLRPMLMARGYSRKGLAWYRHKGNTTTAIFIELGNQRIIVKLARFDRRVLRETHPNAYRATEIIGMSAIVPEFDKWHWARTYNDWIEESDADHFVKLLQDFGLMYLAGWEPRGKK